MTKDERIFKMYKKAKESILITPAGVVWLFLPNATFGKKRMIGKIDYKTKIFYTSPRDKNHLLRMNNSLGISRLLLYRKLKSIRYVCITYEGEKLWTSVLALNTLGTILQFPIKGFEEQIFLELNKFKQSKLEAKNEWIAIKKGIIK